MSGTLTYWVNEGQNKLKSLRLTVCSDEDRGCSGVASLRRKRLERLMGEAVNQGARLSYRDLSMILLTSKATLKRDMVQLKKDGGSFPGGAGLGDE